MKRLLQTAAAALAILGMVLGGSALAQTNITLVTAGASNVTSNSAVLNGSYAVNTGGDRNDRPQTFFQYGLTTSFGQSTVPRSHTRFQDFVNVSISGLVPSATYYARLVAQNRNGLVYGPTITFVTLPDPNASVNTGSGPNGGTNITVIESPDGNVNTGGGTATGGTGTDTGGTTTGGDDTGATGTGNTQTPIPAHIALDINDDREVFTVGDILTYEVEYENVSETAIEDVFIKVELPDNTEFLSAGEGVYLRKEHSVVYDLGRLSTDEAGDVKVNVRAVTALREGTKVAAAAMVLYTNPTTGSQASAVYYDINEYDSDGQAVSSTGGSRGFLPGSFLGWLLIIILLLVIILVGRKIYLRHKEQKEEQQAELELQDVIKREFKGDIESSDQTRNAIENAPRSIDDIEPQAVMEEAASRDVPSDDEFDPWAYEEKVKGSEGEDLDKKKKDFLDNLPS